MMEPDETTMIGDASAAADAWMELLDAGEWAASWRDASSLFRQMVTEEQWTDAHGKVTGVLGRALGRELRDTEHRTSIPGAPDGEYVLLKYDTRFERKEEAIETVVAMLDTDGAWHVGGYFVQ
ncbi:MAG TPA: DUF4019 domain-containing protein [Longimicrobium sp.]|nr:DUF4019 domain-containing protein [Longimicrobium sp.]